MKNLNRIHLGGLRAVEAVGRLGNLRLAAGDLGVTPGAVSQQIQKTERQLGCILFERQRKGLTLTPLGREIMEYLSRGMADLSAAIAIAERQHEQTLTVSVAPVFASKWLVWRLKKFNGLNPDIRIRVEATDQLVDPGLNDVDVCIRVGRGPWPNVVAEKLIGHHIFPVCSPALAAQLKTPSDLANIPIIRDPEAMFGWNVWLKEKGLDDSILGDEGPSFSDGSLCLDAAIAGQGVFLAWETLANDAVAQGQVVAPFDGRYPSGASYWFVTGQFSRKSKSVQDFETWLRDELKQLT